MANGVALLQLAQDVHLMRADGTAKQIATMQDEDCHAALDVIEMYDEASIERELLALAEAKILAGANAAALMILSDLIRRIGHGWLLHTPLVCALRDRSLVSVLA
jgi:hypothetical protein